MSKLNSLLIGAAFLGAAVAEPVAAQTYRQAPAQPAQASAPAVDDFVSDEDTPQYPQSPKPRYYQDGDRYEQDRQTRLEDARAAGEADALAERDSRYNSRYSSRLGDPCAAGDARSLENRAQNWGDRLVGKTGRDVLDVLGQNAGNRIGDRQGRCTMSKLSEEQEEYTRARLRARDGGFLENNSQNNKRLNNWISRSLGIK